MVPFLRQRLNERWWQVGLGFAYVPAIILVVSVESWLRFDEAVIWLSLGVFYVAFVAFIYATARKTR